MSKLSLIAIPGWIDQWLSISKQPLSVLVDYPKLTSTLCKDDVAFYMYCQELSKQVMDPDLIGSFGTFLSESALSPDVYESIERFRLQNPSNSIRPLFDGSLAASAEDGGNSYQDYTFKLVEVTSDVLGYRLVKLDSQYTRQEEQINALSEVLDRLTVYEGFCNAASTPAMKAYVRLTAGL